MKIAFFISEFPTISETFILNQITGLIDKGMEVSIFPSQSKRTGLVHSKVGKYNLLKKTYVVNIPRSRLFRWLKFIFLVMRALFRNTRLLVIFTQLSKLNKREKLELFFRASAIKDNSFDIIQAHFGPNGRQAVFLRQLGLIKGKICVTFHAIDLSKLLRVVDSKEYYQPVFEQADLLLPISDFWRRKLIKLGAKKEKIKVHHMGVDVDEFKFSFRELGKKFKILTVARLVPKKGINYGLKALVKIKKDYQFGYKIIGDGPEKRELIQLIKRLDLTKQVKFLGWQTSNRVKKTMEQANIFLLPCVTASDGDMEGIPVVLMEAMASGLIVISSKHSGIPELIEDDQSGFLVKEKNIDGLAKTLVEIFNCSPNWLTIAKKARMRVEKNYNIKKLNQQLYQLYQSLLRND